jgi:cardiolipin synthase A/B
MYVADLENATEIILSARRRPSPTIKHGKRRLKARIGAGSSSRAAAGAVRIGNVVGAAITNRRVLGPAEARIMAGGGVLLLILAVLAVLWPRVITIPLSILGIWVALSLLIRAYRLHREGKKECEN